MFTQSKCRCRVEDLRLLRVFLGRTEIEVLRKLLELKSRGRTPVTVNELAELMGKSRSSIQRALKRLQELGLVESRWVLRKGGGGYALIYEPLTLDQIIAKLRDKLLNLIEVELEQLRDLLSEAA